MPGVEVDSRLMVRDRGPERHRLGPLRVEPLRFGGERVGEPKRTLRGSKAVRFEQCAGVFSCPLCSLE